MYVCEGPGWIKTNGQGSFCGPQDDISSLDQPRRHCNVGLNTTDFMSLESTLLSIVGKDGGSSFFASLVKNVNVKNLEFLGARFAC